MELSTRKENVLSSIIGAYIQTGEPVGSKGVAAQLGVSSATIRNEMADLTAMGLLEQPHTSAGRVPSRAGYRVYLDRLMEKKPLSQQDARWIDSRLYAGSYDPEKLLHAASRLLAERSHCLAVATTPSGRSAYVKALQFVQTSRRSAMVIMISSAGTMKSRVFKCDFDLSGEIMRIFFRVINKKLVHEPVADITPAMIQSTAAAMGDMAMLMSAPLMAVYEVAQDTMRTDLCLHGQMNLLQYPEFSAGGLRRVMSLMDRRPVFADLLHRATGETQVRLGSETGCPELENASLVTARYQVSGNDAGTLALIGPLRMNYPAVLADMEYTAQTVGKILTAWMKEE